MKYLSVNTVVKAYMDFQGSMSNKSWGFLSILKQVSSTIKSGVTYEIDCNALSNYLEETFCISDDRKKYVSGSAPWYVMFSNKWFEFFQNQGNTTPNIYDVIAWAYRREAFPDDITDIQLLSKFAKDFNIEQEILNKAFSTTQKTLEFVDYQYKETQLQSAFASKGLTMSDKNLTAIKSTVKAAPGELSRGPFIQPLYAALDTTDYLLISQSNFSKLYDLDSVVAEKKQPTKSQTLQQIYYGAPGTGKSHTINEQTEGKSVIRTTFHPDSDYSTFVGAYKPTTKEVPIRDVTGKVVTELNAETGKVEAVKEDRIVYEFVDQAFLQAYVKAWEKYAEAGKNSFNGLVLNNVNGKVYELISIDEDSIYYYNLTTKAEPSKAYRATIKEKFDGIITVDNVQDAIATYLKGINTTDFEAAWTELSRRIEESAAISSQRKTPQVEPQYLVIEEINRGNCAQIFGDLFQLLDRNKWGFSDYPINADKDMKKQLAKAFKNLTINDADSINGHYKGRDVVKEVLNGDILLLPNNLYIWATMNTSDQSLFPIDSAFKRRWDWQYMPIAQGRDEAGNLMAWTIDVNNKKYSWWSFLEKVNAQIGEATQSEDKKLGFFFCKAVDGVISSETFVGKVVFYLWNDVFKDYGFDGPIFKDADNSELSFNKFYKADLKGNAVVQKDKVEQFLKNLGVEIISTTSGDDPMDEVDEDGNNANTANKDFSKYAINGKGSFSKGKVMQEAMKLYAEKHPEMTAEQVMNTWLAIGVNMPNLVETQTLFEERAAKSKDSRVREKAKEVQLANGETIFVSNQFNPDRIADLISKVNAQDWDIKISKI